MCNVEMEHAFVPGVPVDAYAVEVRVSDADTGSTDVAKAEGTTLILVLPVGKKGPS